MPAGPLRRSCILSFPLRLRSGLTEELKDCFIHEEESHTAKSVGPGAQSLGHSISGTFSVMLFSRLRTQTGPIAQMDRAQVS